MKTAKIQFVEELTFPDCPMCGNFKSGKCVFSEECKVKSWNGMRHGIPSHYIKQMKG